MAAEEDKKFDAILGGFLVNDLRVRSGHPHCPEPDLLAAYHERALLPQEMNAWKEHIIGCARCQSILAELEATDAIPLSVRKEEAQIVDAATTVAASVSSPITAPAARPEKARSPRPIRGWRWQWLIPAGALAAGLLVWVAWQEYQPPRFTSPTAIKVAKMEPPPAPALSPPATRQAPASSPSDQLSDLSNYRGVIGGMPAEKKVPPAAENLKQLQSRESRARLAIPKVSTGKESGARQDNERDSLLAANPSQNQIVLDNKAVEAGAMSETAQVQAQAGNVPAQSETAAAQNQLNTQKIAGPSPPGQAGQAAKAKSESAAYAGRILATPAPAPAAPTFSKTASMRLAAVANPHVISAPGSKILWRAGHAGVIEFSSDGGASWLQQNSGVLTDLTSGSAPSDKVCWVVGRAGTILLTTDSGSHWTILHSPLDEDLGGVRATDALHATIWNLGNTKTFETSDGGLTWKLVASP